MTEFITMCGMGLILLVLSVQDLKRRKIDSWICIFSTVLMFMLSIILKASVINTFLGMILGLIMLGVSIITRGKIGFGDGMVLIFTGVGLGFWSNVELFAMALFMAASVSIVLLVLRKVNRHSSLPFVPFLFLSYILVFISKKPWELLLL